MWTSRLVLSRGAIRPQSLFISVVRGSTMPAFSISSLSNSNSRNGRCTNPARRVTSWLSGSRRTSPTLRTRSPAPGWPSSGSAAQHGAQPGHQLRRPQGEDKVVVRSRSQGSGDQVLVVGTDQQDREARHLSPQPLAKGEAVAFESPVDDGDVGPLRRLHRGLGIGGDHDLEAGALEVGGHGVGAQWMSDHHRSSYLWPRGLGLGSGRARSPEPARANPGSHSGCLVAISQCRL